MGFLIFAILFYTLDVSSVPFHPDESTQLYMSRDFDTLITSPLQMGWKPNNPSNDRMIYRLLDPPLTRLWLGFILNLSGLPAPSHDWNWSLSWEENRLNGALPLERTLIIARLSISVWLSLALLSIYFVGKSLGNARAGWLAMVLLGSNALFLLHGRRAMAEGLLMVWICVTLWLMTRRNTSPILTGLSAALAFNAKYLAAPLAVLGLAQNLSGQNRKTGLRALMKFGLAFVGLTWLLNPVLWKHPLEALNQAILQRKALSLAQVKDFRYANPALVIETPAERISNLILQVFFTPPMLSEAANYRNVLEKSYQTYLSNPFHNALRGPVGGSAMLFLTLFGFFTAVISLHGAPQNRETTVLIIAGTLFQIGFILLALPLGFQRYYVPLIPFTTLWAASGLDRILSLLGLARRHTSQKRKK